MTVSITEFFDSIEISDLSATPKYKQLADSIINGIHHKIFKKGDVLPSINEISSFLEVSRDTTEKAYKYLKNKGVIYSAPGKGFFIAVNELKQGPRIAVLLNKLSEHKKIVYDAFASEMGEWSALDLFVYNSDISYLKSLLLNFTKTYDHYVIFPHFKEGADQAAEIISRYIPSEKLLLLSKLIPDLEGEFPAVFENHENDIYTALNKAIEHLKKYETIKLVFPDHSDYPKAIIKGFYKFCQEHGIDHTLVSNLKREKIKSGTCYINIVERDLALLLEKILAQKLEVGKDVGIISYNETPLKKFILNGITTISTNFEYMGKAAAQLIKNKSKEHMEVPFDIIIRASI